LLHFSSYHLYPEKKFYLCFHDMADSKEKEDVISKFNNTNNHEWKRYIQMVLLVKGLWDQLQEDIPPAERVAERTAWNRAQQRAMAIRRYSLILARTLGTGEEYQNRRVDLGSMARVMDRKKSAKKASQAAAV